MNVKFHKITSCLTHDIFRILTECVIAILVKFDILFLGLP